MNLLQSKYSLPSSFIEKLSIPDSVCEKYALAMAELSSAKNILFIYPDNPWIFISLFLEIYHQTSLAPGSRKKDISLNTEISLRSSFKTFIEKTWGDTFPLSIHDILEDSHQTSWIGISPTYFSLFKRLNLQNFQKTLLCIPSSNKTLREEFYTEYPDHSVITLNPPTNHIEGFVLPSEKKLPFLLTRIEPTTLIYCQSRVIAYWLIIQLRFQGLWVETVDNLASPLPSEVHQSIYTQRYHALITYDQTAVYSSYFSKVIFFDAPSNPFMFGSYGEFPIDILACEDFSMNIPQIESLYDIKIPLKNPDSIPEIKYPDVSPVGSDGYVKIPPSFFRLLPS